MKCPFCGCSEDKVIDTRANEDETTIKRRRECLCCGKRFTTYENIELVPLQVIKANGSRQVYDRNKLTNGITKACEKRPVSSDKIDEVVSRIEREIHNGGREVTSTRIGELVMDELRALDQVAYVRFASVYRRFEDIESFKKELDSLK